MASSVLFILHLPPPVHGAAQVGKMILQSRRINEEFECHFLNLATARAMEDLGKLNFIKLFLTMRVLAQTFYLLIKVNPALCYLTLSATGFAFYKDMMVVAILRLFRKKILFHFHHQGVQSESAKRPWKKRFFHFALSHRKATVILLSPALYYDVKDYISPDRIFYCANGVPDIQQQKKEVRNNPSATARILFLSNLLNTKGFRFVLDACEQLAKEGHSFECHFAGEWKDITKDQFQKMAEEKGISNLVKAHGKVAGEEKLQLLREADFFVLPTLNDAFPLVLLEAMQHHLPVISTFEGGIPEIVQQDLTGFLISKNDLPALTDKMRILIQNAPLRSQMGEQARQRYEAIYTVESFEERFISILHKNLTNVF